MKAYIALAECACVCGSAFCAAWVDVRTRTIPNACSLAIVLVHALAIVARSLGGENPPQLLSAAAVGAIVAGIPLVLTALVSGGIGGGDIKLLVALGFALGWQRILAVIFLSCALTVAAGLAYCLALRFAKIQLRFFEVKLPMAPQICIALVIAFWLFPM